MQYWVTVFRWSIGWLNRVAHLTLSVHEVAQAKYLWSEKKHIFLWFFIFTTSTFLVGCCYMKLCFFWKVSSWMVFIFSNVVTTYRNLHWEGPIDSIIKTGIYGDFASYGSVIKHKQWFDSHIIILFILFIPNSLLEILSLTI